MSAMTTAACLIGFHVEEIEASIFREHGFSAVAVLNRVLVMLTRPFGEYRVWSGREKETNVENYVILRNLAESAERVRQIRFNQ